MTCSVGGCKARALAWTRRGGWRCPEHQAVVDGGKEDCDGPAADGGLLANKLHPDKGGDPAAFSELQEAYEAVKAR